MVGSHSLHSHNEFHSYSDSPPVHLSNFLYLLRNGFIDRTSFCFSSSYCRMPCDATQLYFVILAIDYYYYYYLIRISCCHITFQQIHNIITNRIICTYNPQKLANIAHHMNIVIGFYTKSSYLCSNYGIPEDDLNYNENKKCLMFKERLLIFKKKTIRNVFDFCTLIKYYLDKSLKLTSNFGFIFRNYRYCTRFHQILIVYIYNT